MRLWGLTSRLEVATEIVKLLGLEADIKITDVKDYFSRSLQRPSSERLRNKKLEIIGLNYMRPWREVIKIYRGVLEMRKRVLIVAPMAYLQNMGF